MSVDLSVIPKKQPFRPICLHQRDAVASEVKSLIKQDIVEKVPHGEPTTWVSQLVVVVKPDGSVRLCNDSTLVNTCILVPRYNMATIEDIRIKLAGAKKITKIDMNKAYLQIKISKGSRHLTTFQCHLGLFRYKRLYFGLKSAAEIFQRIIHELIHDLDGAVNVQDDILVFGSTDEEHDKFLAIVLERLQRAGLTCNVEKCVFEKSEVIFYGMRFSGDGIFPKEDRVKAIKAFTRPLSTKEVVSFLATANWSSLFINNFATIAAPLRELTHQNIRFYWSDEHEKAFNDVKAALSSNGLSHFKKGWEIIVWTDASPVGLAVYLFQRNPRNHNEIILVDCRSRKLTPAEMNWPQIEKEALGAAWGVEREHLYIFGTFFTLTVDCKPLEMIIRNPSAKSTIRIQKILLRLQPYRFKIVHKSGDQNPADYASRHPASEPEPIDFSSTDQLEETLNHLSAMSIPKSITIEQIKSEIDKDVALFNLREMVKRNKFDNKVSECLPFKKFFDQITVLQDGTLLRDHQLIIPTIFQETIVKQAHFGHQGISRTLNLLLETCWFPNCNSAVKQFIENCNCQLVTRKPIPAPMQFRPEPERCWQSCCMDWKGPLIDNSYRLVVECRKSKFVLLYKHTSESFNSLVLSLNNMINLFGRMEELITDSGPPFNVAEFVEWCAEHNIKHTRITPEHPQANEVERFMPTIDKIIQTAIIEKKNWSKELDNALLAYRATPHQTTKISPAELFFNRKIRTILPFIHIKPPSNLEELAKVRSQLAKLKSKIYTDKKRRAKPCKLLVGDKVVAYRKKLNKAMSHWEPAQYTVTRVKGVMITAVRDHDGCKLVRNCSKFMRWSPLVFRDSLGLPLEAAIPKETSKPSFDSTKELTETQIRAKSTRISRPPLRLQLKKGTKAYYIARR